MQRTHTQHWHYLGHALKTILATLVVFSLIYAATHIKLTKYFPIKRVQVFGVHRVDQQQIQEIVLPLVNKGFFSVNIENIRDRLLQIPWVGDIFVRRYWPDRIEITIVEKNAVATWNEQSLLSDAGVIFMPSRDTFPETIPAFNGPDGKQINVLQTYIEMNRLLLPLHTKIAHLELTPYLSWKLMLDNGIALRLGHKDILTRVGHFVKVYPKVIGDRGTDVEYVDLRYPNGMAVRWRTSDI